MSKITWQPGNSLCESPACGLLPVLATHAGMGSTESQEATRKPSVHLGVVLRLVWVSSQFGQSKGEGQTGGSSALPSWWAPTRVQFLWGSPGLGVTSSSRFVMGNCAQSWDVARGYAGEGGLLVLRPFLQAGGESRRKAT